MRRKITTEEFIRRAREVHGNRYVYTNTYYINAITPITIECVEHGEFQQRPYVHINRSGQCPTCGYEQRATTRRKNNNWWKYQKAKKFVNKLGLTNIKEWNEYCVNGKKISQIPAAPRVTYKNEWEGWEQWIGINGRTKKFLTFEEARVIVHSFDLRSYEDWIFFCDLGARPENIPFNPKKVYSSQWVGWGDWMGYSSRSNGNLPGTIYIIQHNILPLNVYKIGRTYRLDKRIYEHQRINSSKITVVSTFNVKNMKLAEEKAHQIALVHGNQFKYRQSKEHFLIDDIQSLIQHLKQELCFSG